MDIRVKVDTARFNDLAKNYPRNLAFSTANAINDTAKDAQKAIREHMAQVFHIRSANSKAFLDRSIKIMVWANVRGGRPYAIIGIDNKASGRRAKLLSMFEEGGTRTAQVGRRVAVPRVGTGGARPSIESQINPNWLIQSLNMHKAPTAPRHALSGNPRNVKRRKGQASSYQFWQGANGTFMLERSARAPYGGIFRRESAGKGDGAIRMLYSFRPSVPLPAVLSFVETTGQVFEARFMSNLNRRFYHLRGIGG